MFAYEENNLSNDHYWPSNRSRCMVSDYTASSVGATGSQ